MRPFIEDASSGSIRDTIYRAILAYPREEFTSKLLYEFICFDFPLIEDETRPETVKRRSGTTPRNVASLSSLLSQAEREGVITRIRRKPSAIWRRLHTEDIRTTKKKDTKLIGKPVQWGDDH